MINEVVNKTWMFFEEVLRLSLVLLEKLKKEASSRCVWIV